MCTSDTVKDLLNEVGRFLSDVLAAENISEAAEAQRLALLRRLEPHIHTHADVNSAPNTPPPYLDMNGPKVGREEYVDAEVSGERIEEEYEEFPTPSPPPAPHPIKQDAQSSPDYENLSLPYSELRNLTHKCGPLWRKERFIFLDQWRRVWAGLYGHVVLLYNNERDVKPAASLDIQGFHARPVTSSAHKDPKKKDSSFEVVCPGKKTHQFIARTAKDMTQWVLAISQAGSKDPSPPTPRKATLGARRQLPSLPDGEGEVYDDVGSAVTQSNYEPVKSENEEIYHDIADVYQNGSVVQQMKTEQSDAPQVPPRSPNPRLSDDSASEEEVYDDVGVSSSPNMYSNLPQIDVTDGSQVKDKLSETLVDDDSPSDGEVIYDDIGVIEQPLDDSKFLGFRRESSGRIQHLIKQMEASMGNGNKHSGKSKPELVKQLKSEELYEPIEMGSVVEGPVLPQLPPRCNLVK